MRAAVLACVAIACAFTLLQVFRLGILSDQVLRQSPRERTIMSSSAGTMRSVQRVCSVWHVLCSCLLLALLIALCFGAWVLPGSYSFSDTWDAEQQCLRYKYVAH